MWYCLLKLCQELQFSLSLFLNQKQKCKVFMRSNFWTTIFQWHSKNWSISAPNWQFFPSKKRSPRTNSGPWSSTASCPSMPQLPWFWIYIGWNNQNRRKSAFLTWIQIGPGRSESTSKTLIFACFDCFNRYRFRIREVEAWMDKRQWKIKVQNLSLETFF